MRIELIYSHAIHSSRLIDVGMYRSAWFVFLGFCLEIMRHDCLWNSLYISVYNIFLKCALKPYAALGGGTWTGLIWLRIGTRGGLV